MTTLTQVRRNLAAAVDGVAGMTGKAYMPERVVPPAAVVLPDTPYLSVDPGETPFGHHTVTLQLLLIGPKGTNAQAAAAVDDLLAAAVDAAEGGGFAVVEVTEPQRVGLSGVDYLGAVAQVTGNYRIETE